MWIDIDGLYEFVCYLFFSWKVSTTIQIIEMASEPVYEDSQFDILLCFNAVSEIAKEAGQV